MKVPDHLVLIGTTDGHQGRTDVINVVQTPDATAETQRWKPLDRPGGLYQLANRALGLSLWVPGDSNLSTANTWNLVEVPAS